MQAHCRGTAINAGTARTNVPVVNQAVLEWIESFRKAEAKPPKKQAKASQRSESLRYVMMKSRYTGRYVIALFKGKVDAEGKFSGGLEECPMWSVR